MPLQKSRSDPIQYNKYTSINNKENINEKENIITPKIVYESCAIGCKWNMIYM
jgi:hypothetical protein